MKKLLVLVTVMAMVVAMLTACGDKKNNTTPAAEPTATTAPTPTEEATPTPTPTEAPVNNVMSHADYIAASLDDAVIIEAYVMDTQSWWNDKITIYAADKDGGYFIYEAACSKEDSALLTPGKKIHVEGFKSEWAGEVEITDAKLTFIEGDEFMPEAFDATALVGTDDLVKHQNERVVFKGVTITAQDDGAAFKYKNAEDKTDDLYFKGTVDGKEVSFCVEFYLRGQDTDVYKAVEGLKVGDVVDVECYLYWYNGANPHVIAVTK
ncbi:MAG: hypothetical protein IKX54_01935 [Lachnospiraceae bacterium]|nr:hypothetical protein [Lachnospiraceae bacterium]